MGYKRILTIQDISCVGQCSMTVALPILSACGHEVCILPSAVLSTHTGGFGKPAVLSLTDVIPEILAHWKENRIDFDLIYVGYLGSIRAVELVGEVLDTMLAPGGIILVDPAMADHGKLYSGLDENYAGAMTALCRRADVMLPNITEAAMMTGLPYREGLDEGYVSALLQALPGKNAVLTGVGFAPEETGFGVRFSGKIGFSHHRKLPQNYHGTGDIFASALAGALACGKSLMDASKIAAAYTYRCIDITYGAPAHWYGVRFESALPDLIDMLKK